MNRRIISTLFVAACCFLATQTHAKWLKVESPNFVVYSEENRKISEDYARKLENFHYIASHLYIEMGDSYLKPAEKHNFYMFKDISDYGIVRSDIRKNAFNPFYVCEEGYQYFTTSDAKYINTGRSGQDLVKGVDYDLAILFMSLNQTLLVEYFSYKLPQWLESGLNSYMMTTEITADSIVLGKPLPDTAWLSDKYGNSANALNKRHRASFEDIIAGKAIPRDKITYRLQVWAIAHYMMSTPERREQLKNFLKLYAEGIAPLEAFETATGLTPSALDAIYEQYLTKGVPVNTYPLPSIPAADISVQSLPDYRDKLPLLNAALLACPDNSYGEKVLTRIRRQANHTPDDPLTQIALMRGQILFGAPLDALPYLEQRLKNNAADFQAQYWLGRLYLQLAKDGPEDSQAGHYASARKELSKAYQINEASAPLLYFFAISHEDRPDFPNENVLTAINLAQSYSHNRYNLYEIELLIRAGKRDDARAKTEQIHHVCFNDDHCAKVQAILDALAPEIPAGTALEKLNALRESKN